MKTPEKGIFGHFHVGPLDAILKKTKSYIREVPTRFSLKNFHK